MISVIDYRAGNAPSVMYALEHLGLPCRLVGTPAEVAAQVGGKTLEDAFIILQERDEL